MEEAQVHQHRILEKEGSQQEAHEQSSVGLLLMHMQAACYKVDECKHYASAVPLINHNKNVVTKLQNYHAMVDRSCQGST